MYGVEKLFYVNITRDDVKTTIAVSVLVIFFLYYLSVWLIIFSSGDIKYHYRTRIVPLHYRTILKFPLILIEFRNKMAFCIFIQGFFFFFYGIDSIFLKRYSENGFKVISEIKIIKILSNFSKIITGLYTNISWNYISISHREVHACVGF